MIPPDANPYDEVLYNNHALLHTHPNRLAILGRMFGMNPAPIERCRVLELGCGDGSNLIPMAHGLPESQFVGVDLAGRPITNGQSMIEALNLKNIELARMDILDFPTHLGEFDYIITYGLYSWVPAEVREKILAISKTHLKPQGIAFVSYNTYPGWHLRQMVREMMQYHIEPLSNPTQQITQAKALVQFLADSSLGQGGYEQFLKEELRQVTKRTGSTLFHDDLSPTNFPVYFYQFAGDAARHGLQYLAETDFFVTQEVSASAEMVETLNQLQTDVIKREQYLDFLRCRRFRQTLLCHDSLQLNRTPGLDCLEDLHFLSLSSPVSDEVDLTPGVVVEFRGGQGAAMSTAHPLSKAVLGYLSKSWPRAPQLQEILSEVQSRLAEISGVAGEPPPSLAESVGQLLLAAYGAGLLDALLHVPRFALELTEHPMASPIARLQLQRGSTVTSLLHTTLDIKDPLAKHLLLLLDGTRDRFELVRELSQLVASGVTTLQDNGKPIEDKAEACRLLAEQLDQALVNISRIPLLVG